MRATIIAALILVSGCYGAPEQLIETPAQGRLEQPAPQQEQPAPEGPRIVCDMTKFTFTQDVGCVNDGWVEFCAVKSGAPVVTSLRALAPEVQILEGLRGRAGCDEATEYLVSQPIRESDCSHRYGALTDAAWNTLCALSQVPETKRFVPGFAE